MACASCLKNYGTDIKLNRHYARQPICGYNFTTDR